MLQDLYEGQGTTCGVGFLQSPFYGFQESNSDYQACVASNFVH